MKLVQYLKKIFHVHKWVMYEKEKFIKLTERGQKLLHKEILPVKVPYRRCPKCFRIERQTAVLMSTTIDFVEPYKVVKPGIYGKKEEIVR